MLWRLCDVECWYASLGAPLMANKIRDLTGQRFGKLTAIAISTKTPKIMWACVCDCGGEKSVPSGQLTGGQVKSCGCLLRGPKDTWKSVLGVVESGWTCLEYVNTTKQGHVFLWQHVCGRTLKTTRFKIKGGRIALCRCCLLYTSPSPRDS